jgi:hypothetical protein
MPKIVRLAEGDLIGLIRRVLSESENESSSPDQQAAIAINMKKKGKKPKVIAVTEEQFERLFQMASFNLKINRLIILIPKLIVRKTFKDF